MHESSQVCCRSRLVVAQTAPLVVPLLPLLLLCDENTDLRFDEAFAPSTPLPFDVEAAEFAAPDVAVLAALPDAPAVSAALPEELVEPLAFARDET